MFLSITGICSLYAKDTKVSEFVITPVAATKKNMSLNTLKEHIGKTTKQAFECTTEVGKYSGQALSALSRLQVAVVDNGSHDQACLKEMLSASAAYNRALGNMQQKLAQLQQKCSLIVEKLIDNHVPFKKASKKILENTLALLTTTHQQLNACSRSLQKVNSDLKKTEFSMSTNLSGSKPCAKVIKADAAVVVKAVQGATKVLQDKESILQQILTSFNADECLKTL